MNAFVSTCRLALLAALATLLAGCLSVDAPLHKAAPPAPDKAYVYGRFAMTADSPYGGLYGMGRITLNLTPTAGGDPVNLMLQFPSSDPVYAVAIPPGEYRISGWSAGDDKRSKAFSSGNDTVSQPFQAAAGQAYYLGDFTGQYAQNHSGSYIHHNWGIKEVSYNFAATDADFRKRYPTLADLPHIDLHPDMSRSEPMARDTRVMAGNGVIFGRFLLRQTGMDTTEEPLVQLRLHHRDTRDTVLITLSSSTPLQAFVAAPGPYVVDGLEVNNAPFAEGSKFLPGEIFVDAGEATYVGDVELVVTLERRGQKTVKRGKVEPVQWNLDTAAEELRAALPQLAEMRMKSGL